MDIAFAPTRTTVQMEKIPEENLQATECPAVINTELEVSCDSCIVCAYNVYRSYHYCQKSLSIRDGQSIDANGRNPASAKPRRTWDSLSREAQALLTKLAGNNTGPMSVRVTEYHIHWGATAAKTARTDSSVMGRGQSDVR